VVDMAAIGSAVGSLKAAGDIAYAMLKLHDAKALQEKTIELNSVIIAAQRDAMAAHTAQTDLVAEIRDLKEEITRMKNWEADKARYELADIGAGIVALAIKKAERGSEPFHRICADCATNGKKFYLQPVLSGPYYEKYKCHGCGIELEIHKGNPPQPDWRGEED